MKFHHLVVKNFRGIEHLEVAFDEELTVIVGPNESGKSSLPEAITLLRTTKASSRSMYVKRLQPVGRDVGPEVSLTLTMGKYRLQYRKRWLKRSLTELTIDQPRPEKVVGDDAHNRFLAIVDETADRTLLEALAVTQGGSLQQPEVANIPALQDALNDAEEADDGHDSLLEAIESRYASFFTKSGKPNSEMAALTASLRDAEVRLSALSQRVSRAAELEQQLRHTQQQEPALRQRFEIAEEHRDTIRADLERTNTLRQRLAIAEAQASQVAGEKKLIERQLQELEILHASKAELVERIASSQKQLNNAEAQYQETLQDSEQATIRQRECAQKVIGLRKELQLWETQRDYLAQRARLQSVTEQLHHIEALEKEVAELTTHIEANSMEDETLAAIEQSHEEVIRAKAAAQASATSVRVDQLGSHAVTVDDQHISSPHVSAVTQPMRIRVPGIVEVQLSPAADASQAAQMLADAQAQLNQLCARYGVKSPDEARQRAQQRRELLGRKRHITQQLDAARAQRSVAQLRTDLGELEAALLSCGEIEITASSEKLAAQIAAGRTQLQAAQAAEKQASETLERVRTLAAERSTHTALAARELKECTGELQRITQTVTERSRQVDEDALRQALTAANDASHAAHQRQSELTRELAELREEELEIKAATAEQELQEIRSAIAQVESDKHRYLGAMEQVELRELTKEHDDLIAQVEMLRGQYRRRSSQANAVHVLREVMLKHKEQLQRSYAAKFSVKIQELGINIFGEDFRVEIDDQLRIVERHHNGVKVPFADLSSGAQEQLALLGRAAVARLVGDDGAPLIIDDALGFADEERLLAMCGLLKHVATHTQVVILTCQPERYGSIQEHATLVDLAVSRQQTAQHS